MRMKKVMKVIGITIIIIVVLLLICYVNHSIQSKKEKELLKPLGTMVTVDNKQMSIYTEGEGTKNLVFMSGGGTCSPILDFKSLYSLLSDEYKIVVVEKFGYGFSDIVNEKRDIDTILEETRAALQKSGIDGPYVLCPHSMSGIEALYWAQKYPNEVSAIIGLDMAVPEAYENYEIDMLTIKLGQFASKVGITRMIPQIANGDAVKFGTLSDTEKDIYKAVFYSRTATDTMIDEVTYIKGNVKVVSDGEIPNIPILMFCSNGNGTGWNEETWRKIQTKYISNCASGKMIELDCSHYIHNYEYEKIANEIRAFLD
ncbi:alpha/beta fold hydrolase [Terrisporobacter vanillatitrophus]|uniref:alpha/beta fold hydrolase n=1 Tax=Terrisporobacter vanillatitrophus TaxID=3058402 RepID=UPI003368B5EC